MKTLQLKENFWWTGIVDENLKVFDIIMYTEFGTSYNSYVLKSGQMTILFETAKAKFKEEWMDKIKEVCDISNIDYLVMSHTEPDHAGSVETLLDVSPNMKIIGTSAAITFLKEIVNRDFYSTSVKDNQTMKLGDRPFDSLSCRISTGQIPCIPTSKRIKRCSLVTPLVVTMPTKMCFLVSLRIKRALKKQQNITSIVSFLPLKALWKRPFPESKSWTLTSFARDMAPCWM